MGGKGGTSPPAWDSLLGTPSMPTSLDDRLAFVQPFVSQVQAVLEENISQPAGSQKLFTALAVGALNKAVTAIDPHKPHSYGQLIALNDVVISSDRRLSLVLVEHQFLTSLWRLHQKVGNMSYQLSQAVVLIFCSITLRAEGAAGSMETIVSKPELGELLIANLTFLAVTPDALLSPAGLGTAQRCIQTCWELTRAPTPKCTEFRNKLQQMQMAGRALQIAAAAVEPGAATQGTGDIGQAAIARAALLEDHRGTLAAELSDENSDADAAAATSNGLGNGMGSYEDRLSLAAQACSFAANLAGLGTRGIELSAAGLAPQRRWLLKPHTLASLRLPLEGLIDGLAELRRRIELQGPDAAGQEFAAGKLPEDVDLWTSLMPRKRLVGQVEGAVRNVLMLLGLPTIVMGRGEEDVVDSCSFVIRHSFGLFTEGYVDTMRALRSVVANPPTAQGFTAPYPGDYADFFRAFAGHVETVATALGVQLADWGVRFTGEQAARDLPEMQVSEGVDVRIAHSWLKDQIQPIIDWGHAMMLIIRMADQTKMTAFRQQQGQGQGGIDRALPKPAPPHGGPYGAPAAADEGASGGASALGVGPACCGTCGATAAPDGPPLLWCSRCRTVRYCSRACQLGHWPQHKLGCRSQPAVTAAAAAAAAVAPAVVSDAAVASMDQRKGQMPQ